MKQFQLSFKFPNTKYEYPIYPSDPYPWKGRISDCLFSEKEAEKLEDYFEMRGAKLIRKTKNSKLLQKSMEGPRIIFETPSGVFFQLILHDEELSIIEPTHPLFKLIVKRFMEELWHSELLLPYCYQGKKTYILVEPSKGIWTKFSKEGKYEGLCLEIDGTMESIKRQNAVVLVEGYIDAITLYKQGITNTIALGGYRLTDSKIDKLKSLTHNFYIMMDNDQAGKLACQTICKQLSDKGLNAYAIDISILKDSYELLNSIENKQSYMKKLINIAKRWHQWKKHE